MLYAFLIILQILISILMVVGILLQSSKGGGLAGIAGGLASSAVFGGRSAASFLTKGTTVLATLFFLNCLGMAVLSARTGPATSVTQQAVTQESSASPVPLIPGGAAVEPAPASEQQPSTGSQLPPAEGQRTVEPIEAPPPGTGESSAEGN